MALDEPGDRVPRPLRGRGPDAGQVADREIALAAEVERQERDEATGQAGTTPSVSAVDDRDVRPAASAAHSS